MSFDIYMDFAHTLADETGEIARKYFRKELKVETKADASPVSIADKEIEQMLRAMICAQFPNHGILGEEFDNDGTDKEYVWIIDPIDGTRAFIAGQATFTTLIALCYRGVPVLGVIDQPVLMERYSGIEGTSSLLNGQPIQVRECGGLGEAELATTSTELFNIERRPKFENVAVACKAVKQGGDAYNYARLADGHGDLVIESGLKPYDALALRPVIEGAGGVITTWEGRPLTLTDYAHVCAAGDKRVHKEALALLV